jgi:hypothetical protein
MRWEGRKVELSGEGVIKVATMMVAGGWLLKCNIPCCCWRIPPWCASSNFLLLAYHLASAPTIVA